MKGWRLLPFTRNGMYVLITLYPAPWDSSLFSFEPLQLDFDSTKFSGSYNGSSYVAAYLAYNWTPATTIEKGGSAGFSSMYILGYLLKPLYR